MLFYKKIAATALPTIKIFLFLNAFDPAKYPLTGDELKKDNWGVDDLQMGEPPKILKDMIYLHLSQKAPYKL